MSLFRCGDLVAFQSSDSEDGPLKGVIESFSLNDLGEVCADINVLRNQRNLRGRLIEREYLRTVHMAKVEHYDFTQRFLEQAAAEGRK